MDPFVKNPCRVAILYFDNVCDPIVEANIYESDREADCDQIVNPNVSENDPIGNSGKVLDAFG